MGSNFEKVGKLKLISERFVKPENVIQKEPHHLNVKDLFALSIDTMQKGLLFDTKSDNNFISKLEKSLYVSLVHFYPLAGRFVTQKFYDEHACSMYVDYDTSPGARLVHASVDYTVSDISSSVDVHSIVDSFFDLGERSVNYDGHTRPLLLIQVTELIDGVFIGFTMNHCLADGNSLWHYISTLSEIFGRLDESDDNGNDNEDLSNKITISRKPVFDILLADNNVMGPIFKLPYLEPNEFIFRYTPGPLRVRIFRFSPESVSVLKSQANRDCGPAHNISSFQAVCGFIWRSIIRARNLQPELEVSCGLAINIRNRIDPPLPPDYFRCFLAGSSAVSKVGELLSNGPGRAALLINQVIKNHKNQTVRTMFEQFIERRLGINRPGPGSAARRPYSVGIGGSSKFDMYGSEFGLGKARTVLAGYANKDDGKITGNPGREGCGSIDLEVCLKPETMNALEVDQEFMNFVSH